MSKAMLILLAGMMGTTTTLSAQSAPVRTIVDVAAEAGSFNTLLTAVRAAGLEEALRGAGPFTVFAPTDAAFAALPAGTVESLLADPAQLKAVLTYHVISGRVTASDVIGAGMAHPTTLQGGSLNVRVVDGKVMVDQATVVTPDVAASNGVIHVIDRVILPGGF